MSSNTASKQISVTRALGVIFFSAIICNTLAYIGIRAYFTSNKNAKVNFITAIVQTGPQKEALKTDYLAELLSLTKDSPPLVSHFSLSKAKERLLSSPVIKEAKVQILQPGILYVDYTVRQPLALISDLENTAVDEHGVLFPLNPFFPPKNLPEFYLGLPREAMKWKMPLACREYILAEQLFHLFYQPALQELFHLKKIDVSKAFDESFARREIVVTLEDEIAIRAEGREVVCFFPRLLRLSTKNYAAALNNYLSFRQELLETERTKFSAFTGVENQIRMPERVVDLRIPEVAFLDE